MAKNGLYFTYLLFSLLCGSGCVYKDDLTDTAPGDEINKRPPEEVVPLEEAVAVFDTIKVSKDKKVVVVTPAMLDLRQSVRLAYNSQVGVRELTGRNDGPQVEAYLRSAGLGKGNPWCAAFVKWCFARGGLKTPITAWSPTALNVNNLTWFRNKRLKEIKTADVGVLYYPALKRIGHTFFWDRAVNDNIYESVEGNTNDANSREGDGVYRRKRSFNATFAISSWIK